MKWPIGCIENVMTFENLNFCTKYQSQDFSLFLSLPPSVSLYSIWKVAVTSYTCQFIEYKQITFNELWNVIIICRSAYLMRGCLPANPKAHKHRPIEFRILIMFDCYKLLTQNENRFNHSKLCWLPLCLCENWHQSPVQKIKSATGQNRTESISTSNSFAQFIQILMEKDI